MTKTKITGAKGYLLVVCCGGGGSSGGYDRLGWRVTGVDNKPQAAYPWEFEQADGAEFLKQYGHLFDAVHVSPPCQGYSPVKHLANWRGTARKERTDLISIFRDILVNLGKPYIIENVVQAPLVNPVKLCGQVLGLTMYRHRIFETSFAVPQPSHGKHEKLCVRNGYLPTPERPYMTVTGRNAHHSKAWVAKAAEVMGTPWLAEDINAVCEAVPPAYTEYVGRWIS